MNSIIVVGRLGQDPELRYTQSQKAVVTLSVATDRRSGDGQKETDWHQCVCWEKTAENCAKYLKKGRQVAVHGTLQYRMWEDKQGVKHKAAEIVAHNVEFLGDGQKKEGGDDAGF